jgi:hypothetical protein
VSGAREKEILEVAVLATPCGHALAVRVHVGSVSPGTDILAGSFRPYDAANFVRSNVTA